MGINMMPQQIMWMRPRATRSLIQTKQPHHCNKQLIFTQVKRFGVLTFNVGMFFTVTFIN
jgi:hypothetical protein